MFGLIMGNHIISRVVGEGMTELSGEVRPPVIEFCYLLDKDGNDLLDKVDYSLTTKCGRIYQIYGSDTVNLLDYEEFNLGVRN